MTVELTDTEARKIIDMLRGNERLLLSEFPSDVDSVDDTEAGKLATRIERRLNDTEQ